MNKLFLILILFLTSCQAKSQLEIEKDVKFWATAHEFCDTFQSMMFLREYGDFEDVEAKWNALYLELKYSEKTKEQEKAVKKLFEKEFDKDTDCTYLLNRYQKASRQLR